MIFACQKNHQREEERKKKTNISIISSKINYCNHINSRGYRERERAGRPADWGKNDQWSSKLNIRKFSVDFYSVPRKGEMGDREREREKVPPFGYGLHISLANQDANLKKINSCATSRSCDLSARGFVYSQGCTAIIIWYFKTKDRLQDDLRSCVINTEPPLDVVPLRISLNTYTEICGDPTRPGFMQRGTVTRRLIEILWVAQT